MTLAVSIAQSGANNVTMRNRIINGAMMIDQRNAGASISNNGYAVDRFLSFQDGSAVSFTSQQSSTAPAGFTNSMLSTVTSSGTLGAGNAVGFQQRIEGYNIADLGWGTSNAQSVTLSFWVRSSLTGTFSGSLANGAFNRSYPYTFTISSANTWEYKTITIPGDQSGTWLTTNGIGIRVYWDFGSYSTYRGSAGAWASSGLLGATGAVNLVGTNGATFYITGVQLEEGSTATAFEQRLFGTELNLCQRYFEKSMRQESAVADGVQSADRKVCVAYGTNSPSYYGRFMVTKRTAPTLTLYKGANAGTNGQWSYYSTATSWATMTTGTTVIRDSEFAIDFAATMTANASYILDGQWTASAEL